MRCPKCGNEINQGKFCQNCGEKIKFPTYIMVMVIITFLLSRLIGLICLSACTMSKIYLKNGDISKYEKFLDISKIVCISGLIIAIIINVVYICVNVL